MSSNWISSIIRNKIYQRDQNVCCYCGIVTTPRNVSGVMNDATTTLDHVVSQKELAQAATDDAHFSQMQKDAKNLVVACNACNSSKGHTPLFVWCKQTGRDYASIIIEIGKRIQKELV